MKLNRTMIFLIFTFKLFILSQNKLVAIIGETNSGKSCFINTITGKNLTDVGHQDSILGVATSKIYPSKIDGFERQDEYDLLDTIGMIGSSSDSHSLADSILAIGNYLNKTKSHLTSILFFHTLKDYKSLENHLKYLTETFGSNILETTILIINKNNNVNYEELNTFITKFPGLQYLHWKSKCSSGISEIYYEQIEELEKKFSSLQTRDSIFINNLIQVLQSQTNTGDIDEYTRKLKSKFSFKNFFFSIFGSIFFQAYLDSGLYTWQTNELNKIGNTQNLIELSIQNRIINFK
jgi:hypothetical protein